MDHVRIDIADAKRLASGLDRSANLSLTAVRAVVAKGAFNIKKDARRRASGIAHAPMYPFTITYDSHVTPTGAWAEIGPDPDKQVGGGPHRTPGNLGSILENGTPRNEPIPHLAPALAAEEPRFVKALEAAVLKALGL